MRENCSCGAAATHQLDELHYCCACFDLAVANCANIRAVAQALCQEKPCLPAHR